MLACWLLAGMPLAFAAEAVAVVGAHHGKFLVSVGVVVGEGRSPGTLTTGTTAVRPDVGVLGGVPMSLRAMSSRALGVNASLPVDAMGDGLQVFRVHTTTIPAEMIQLKSARNRADEHFVGDAVGAPGQSPLPCRYNEIVAIAPAQGVSPLPARRTVVEVLGADDELLAEPFGQKVGVHSDLLFLGEVADRQFDDGRVGEAESVGQHGDNAETFRCEPVARSQFGSHEGNITAKGGVTQVAWRHRSEV